jgi:RNA polymerase sigma factor (sigma-70 family)
MSSLERDPSLLSRFRSGDRAALEMVFRAHAQDVTNTLRGMLMRRLDAPAAVTLVADLTQETFIRAFSESGRRGYDGIRPYGAYLAAISRNLLVDWLRKRKQEQIVELNDGRGLDDVVRDEAPPPPWDDPAVMMLVERYVAGLDEPAKSVYRKRYVEGAGQEATATTLGLSRQRVRTIEEKLRLGLSVALRETIPDEITNQVASRHVDRTI